jgi:hypothetical protein
VAAVQSPDCPPAQGPAGASATSPQLCGGWDSWYLRAFLTEGRPWAAVEAFLAAAVAGRATFADLGLQPPHELCFAGSSLHGGELACGLAGEQPSRAAQGPGAHGAAPLPEGGAASCAAKAPPRGGNRERHTYQVRCTPHTTALLQGAGSGQAGPPLQRLPLWQALSVWPGSPGPPARTPPPPAQVDIAFLGSAFDGWAFQPGRDTVQANLEASLARPTRPTATATPRPALLRGCPTRRSPCASLAAGGAGRATGPQRRGAPGRGGQRGPHGRGRERAVHGAAMWAEGRERQGPAVARQARDPAPPRPAPSPCPSTPGPTSRPPPCAPPCPPPAPGCCAL